MCVCASSGLKGPLVCQSVVAVDISINKYSYQKVLPHYRWFIEVLVGWARRRQSPNSARPLGRAVLGLITHDFVYFLFTLCKSICLHFKPNVNKKHLLHKNDVKYLSLQNFPKDLYFTRMSQYNLGKVHAKYYRILTKGSKVCICSILLNGNNPL